MRFHGLPLGAALMLAAAACDETRPLGPGTPPGDTLPPSVRITALRPGPLVTKGELVLVDVRVDDNDEVGGIDATVKGAVGFQFQTIVPDSLPFLVQFPIPTEDAQIGTVTFVVRAFDVANNTSADSISFSVLVPIPP